MKTVRTRFAPSPTGFLHIGGLRTALYSYAFAKSQEGKMILRIEDTDRRRFVPGATERTYELLKTFGLSWDEGPLVGGSHEPYIQSERVGTGVYKKYAEQLVKEGHAYYCFCQIKSEDEIQEDQEEKKVKLRDEECRNLTLSEIEEKIQSGLKPAIRLRVPDESRVVEYHDFVINSKHPDKKIGWSTRDIDEVMLLKSDGFPTYHLAVVVDDALMEITHILRGHDWLPSTPVHLFLHEYLGFKCPEIGHLTDILDPEGGKLSKRKGSVSCEEFLAEGYLPEAILNFIMLLGWAPKDNRELFTLSEFVENFQKGSLQIANPVFNRKKLDWFNGIYIRQKSDKELLSLLKPFLPSKADEDLVLKTIPLVKERMTKLSEYPKLTQFFFEDVQVDTNLLTPNAKEQLSQAKEVLDKFQDWNKLEVEKTLQSLVEKEGWLMGEFFMNFRIALTGSKITPPITDSIVLLGKEKTLKRLESVFSLL